MADIRVLLVDDSPPFLVAAAGFLGMTPGIQAVGALSAREGLEQARRQPPDLVLLDLDMPEMNGFEALPLFKKLPGPPRVIIVTMHDAPAFRGAATDFGADGFVSKSAVSTQLLPLVLKLCSEPTGAPP